MSVERVSPTTATAALQLEGSGDQQEGFSIYDIFGTEGCLLGCEERGSVPVPKKRRETRAHRRAAFEPDPFTIAQLEQSETNGCGTCGIFKSILGLVFQPMAQTISANGPIKSDCRYKISANYKLTRIVGDDAAKDEQSCQLFYPTGKSSATKLTYLEMCLPSGKVLLCMIERCLCLTFSWEGQNHYAVLAHGSRDAQTPIQDVRLRRTRPYPVDYWT